MLIIAGLGNPGAKYANNRHNIGFMAVDEIAHRHSFSPWKNKFRSFITQGEIAGEKILLIKPQTMMNLSGEALGEAMRFYKLTPADILVIYDELDLAPAKARIKTGGGAGGHNGIKSTIAHCGEAFNRLRLGIGHPGHKDKVSKYVLSDFAKADHVWLEPLLQAIGDNADLLAAAKHSTFMNKLALAVQGSVKGSKSDADQPSKKPNKNSGKKQSHIKQARAQSPDAKLPNSGPMAQMLKKLFGSNE